MPADDINKITVVRLNNNKKKRIPTVLVTAYDYPQAYLVDQAGVDCILVGDSANMVCHGHPTTIGMTMEQMVWHTEDVVRATEKAFIIADFPFGSYQSSDELAVRNAERFVIAGAQCVKVEGAMYSRIKAICDAGIMVMSHLGLTPQTRAKLGGYRVQGKTKKDFDIIMEQALRLQDAGCSFLLLEAMPCEPAGLIAEALEIPVYGVGAGDLVDGQLVIFHDLTALFFKFKSKFVKQYCQAGKIIYDAISQYAQEVRDGTFPSKEHFYEVKPEELESMLADNAWKYDKVKLPKEQLPHPCSTVDKIKAKELKKEFTHPNE